MIDFDLKTYQPTDTLYLWWLGKPAQPQLIGTLSTVRGLRGVSLRYAPTWLNTGFALSEDMPLVDSEFLPTETETAAGAVDDARPDRWGERVIRFLEKPPRLSVLDFLFYAGDERFGALGVSPTGETYRPRRFGPLPQLADVAALEQLVRRVLIGESMDPLQQRLMAPGGAMGGARPKALITIDGHPWIVKFSEPGESINMPLVEHATMTLAAKAGIRVAETRPIALPSGHALAVKRFDRGDGRRVHAVSAKVALKAAGEGMGYPELAQILRRRGVADGGLRLQHMRELFCRMVFNILMDNTDDHEKNHVLLMDDRGQYALSPAFDVLPSGQALGYQQMRVGTAQADATLINALSEHQHFGLKSSAAVALVATVAAVVSGWRAHFASMGVATADISALATQIDRPFLRAQRDQWPQKA
ncbi:MAG: type II toxin-antitoxin system HipA family toxin [Comamonadaceae bacterium]|nr:type II toxin-antitoxin system HipA family toxin [Comamonadaceae bacterium]